MVGQSEIVVAAKPNDGMVIKVVANALALGYWRRKSGQASALLVRELFDEAAIQGSWHGA